MSLPQIENGFEMTENKVNHSQPPNLLSFRKAVNAATRMSQLSVTMI